MSIVTRLLFSPPTSETRADIQAMRALAVVAVVLYHLWPHRLVGGYAGVDIFFVISGFLMTSHILKGLEGGGWERGKRLKFFSEFYFRRIRRLAPAALVALAGVLIIFWALFYEKAFLLLSTARQVISSALFSQNWILWLDAVDYLAQESEVTAVEHFWSLSLEEQFYLIWPLFLMLIVLLGIRAGRKSRFLFFFIAIFTSTSFVYCVYLTYNFPSAAYFVTPSRLWEMSLGGLIALIPLTNTSRSVISDKLIQFSPYIGLLMCVGSVIFLDAKSIRFPGYWALIPTLGTGLIILTGSKTSLFERISLFRPLQFIGNISYSLYLWHFIILKAFYFYDIYYGDGTLYHYEKLLLILPGSVLLASLSYYLIEQPCLRIKNRNTLLYGVGLFLVVLLLAAYATYNYGMNTGGQDRVEINNRLQSSITNILEGSAITPDMCLGSISIDHPEVCQSTFGQVNAGLLQDAGRDLDEATKCDNVLFSTPDKICVLGKVDSDKSVLLWGDSHAMHFSNALDIAAKQLGIKLVVAVRSSCPPLLFTESDAQKVFDQGNEQLVRNAPGCWKRNSWVVSSREFQTAEIVILSSVYFSAAEHKHNAHLFADNFAALGSKNIVFIRDVPQIAVYPDFVPADLKNKSEFMLNKGVYSVPKSHVSVGDELFAALDEAKANYFRLDTTDRFCKDDKCYLAIGSIPVYRDGGHLSGTYSTSLGPWFVKQIREIQQAKLLQNAP